MHEHDDHASTVGGTEDPRPALTRWGSLEIRRQLGRGSFGVVYRAWDPQLAREVALKIVSQDLSADRAASADILAEARRLASVRHANVVTVYGADSSEGSIGLWMELLEGRTLRQLVAERGVFGASEALAAGIDVCSAVAAVHNAGLVHRDIKADNIMRETGGRIVLMDFGCGAGRTDRLLRETMAGTPPYWAPEILEGQPATVRTDVYSIGVLLFYLLTRRYPVAGATTEELQQRHRDGTRERLDDARPDVPAALVGVIERAIDPDPQRRPATAGELRAALVAASEWLPASAMLGSVEHSAMTTTARRRSIGRRALVWIPIALVLAGVPAAYLWRARARPAPDAAVAGLIDSIVVLPFKDLTGDPNETFLANAVAQELTTALEERGEIRTIPYSFVRQQLDQRRDLQDIVVRTGASGMIEGSVQLVPAVNNQGRTVRISTSLRNAKGGKLIWSNTSENDLGRLLPATGEIAEGVAVRVGLALAVRQEARRTRPSADDTTLELYLRGRDMWSRANSAQALNETIDVFNRTISRDPRFVPAYAAVAQCYANLSAAWNGMPGPAAFARVLANTDKAIAIDPADPETWAARAYGRFLLAWDWTRAAEEFGRALSAGASTEGVRREYLLFLQAVGRHAEATAQGETIVATFPMLADSHRSAAWAYYFARNYDASIASATEALRLNPDYTLAQTLLVRAYTGKGMHAEAIAALRPLAESSRGRPFRPMLSYTLAAAGQRDEAKKILADYVSSPGTQLDYEVAIAYSALAMPDRALALLQKCYKERNPQLVNVAVDPRFDALRTRPEFQALIRSMHYPDSVNSPSTPPKKERVNGQEEKSALRRSA